MTLSAESPRAFGVFSAKKVPPPHPPSPSLPPPRGEPGLPRTRRGGYHPPIFRQPDRRTVRFLRRGLPLPSAFPLRGRWPSGARSDEVSPFCGQLPPPAFGVFSAKKVPPPHPPSPSLPPPRGEPGLPRTRRGGYHPPIFRQPDRRTVRFLRRGLPLPSAFPLRGRWPSGARSDEVSPFCGRLPPPAFGVFLPPLFFRSPLFFPLDS